MIDHEVGEVADNVLVVDDRVKEVDKRVKAIDDMIVAVNDGAEYVFYPLSYICLTTLTHNHS
jgi:hypothetical protein